MTAHTSHARQEPPMLEQRPADSRSVQCRGPAPAAGHWRYSGHRSGATAIAVRRPAGAERS